MLYATYEYYVEDFYGSAIPNEDVFLKAIKKASTYLDSFTFGRISKENVEEYSVIKDCACDMAEAVYNTLGSSGNKREKKSENTDGYSVTYVTENTDGISVEYTLKNKLYSIAKMYLMNTGLLSLEC